MAFSLNRVQLIGNVGKDPEVRFSQSGAAIANLSLATSESWKDQQGERQEKTEWHRVVVFGKLAEFVQNHIRKGAKLYVEGQLETRKWQDQNGNDRYSTEVKVAGFGGNIIPLDRPSGGGQGGGQQAQPRLSYAHQPPQQAAAQEDSRQGPDFDDDIPF